MHGDEVVGREMLMRLIHTLLNEYGQDQLVTDVVNNNNIFIVPTMNPDGFTLGTRENANRYDLNRNFPDQFKDNDNTMTGREIEVQNIMKWISSQQFTLSANLHGGDIVVNYPWDGSPKPIPPRNNPTTDDDTFRALAMEYAKHNPSMMSNPSFEDGITNGAAWYSLFGGMQDWNYIWRGCMETTLELSYVKWPRSSELDGFWDENRYSLLIYLNQTRHGFRGVISDSKSKKPINNAQIKIVDRELVQSRENGAYFRIIPKGDYEVEITADKYHLLQKTIHVMDDPTILNFELEPLESRSIQSKTNVNLGLVIVLILTVIGLSTSVVLFAFYMIKM